MLLLLLLLLLLRPPGSRACFSYCSALLRPAADGAMTSLRSGPGSRAP